MGISTYNSIKYRLLLLPVIAVIFSCNYSKPQLTYGEIGYVQGQVTGLTKNISKDLATKGPAAWLDYIQDTSYFFMANNGELNFKDYKSAAAFVKDSLVTKVKSINLQWNNLRVDPLSDYAACLGADYHEDITGTNGKTATFDGYVTATAVLIGDDWKLRNLHWSAKVPKQSAKYH